MEEIYEEYTNTRDLKILTAQQMKIPGLALLGKQIRTAAIDGLPPHDHGSRFEIVYVVSGNPSFCIGSRRYTLSGGDVFVTRPYEIHGTSSRPVAISGMYWLQIDLLGQSDPLFLDRGTAAALHRNLMELTDPVVSTDLSQMKRLIQAGFRWAWTGENPRLAAQYLTLFLHLIPEYARHGEEKITPDIQSTVDYVNSHIREKISLDTLAQMCYLSTSQFKQKFKQQMGTAPRQFINSQKMEYAKKLLCQGYTATGVAETLEFKNTSYFITVFRRYTSCTPGEYKKQMQTP